MTVICFFFHDSAIGIQHAIETYPVYYAMLPSGLCHVLPYSLIIGSVVIKEPIKNQNCLQVMVELTGFYVLFDLYITFRRLMMFEKMMGL